MSLPLQPTAIEGILRWVGQADYDGVWHAMRAFTESRDDQTPDQIWLVEHKPVYTLGQAGKPEHVLAPCEIPVVQSDRGGQVTYHGPGQVVAYVLMDLRRLGLTVRDMVDRLETSVIDTLHLFGIHDATRKPGAPGVYVPLSGSAGELAKIAALGLKVRKGCTYHGVSLNVDMDLAPFEWINPCGYPGLRTVSMRTQGVCANWDDVALALAGNIMRVCALRVE